MEAKVPVRALKGGFVQAVSGARFGSRAHRQATQRGCTASASGTASKIGTSADGLVSLMMTVTRGPSARNVR